jgi:hypothetical protein
MRKEQKDCGGGRMRNEQKDCGGEEKRKPHI